MLAKIMIVEDERIVAFSIRRRLADFGYEVPAIAASGEEALRMAQVIIPFPPLIRRAVTFLGDTRSGSDGIVSGLWSSGVHRESPALAPSSRYLSRHGPSADER
jgi:hypothetical protein